MVTHGHFDHVADAPALAKLNNAPLRVPTGLAQSLGSLGIAPLANRINRGATVMPLGEKIKITLVHAEPSSEYVCPQSGTEEVHVGGEPGASNEMRRYSEILIRHFEHNHYASITIT